MNKKESLLRKQNMMRNNRLQRMINTEVDKILESAEQIKKLKGMLIDESKGE